MNVRKALLGIVALALIARVGAMVMLQTWSFPNERDFGMEEGEIAYAMATGQGYSWPQTWRAVGPPGSMVKYDRPEPTTWKAPINPIIIAGMFWLFGPYSVQAAVALEFFQVLLSLLSCYVLFRIGRMLFNEWTGLVAALVFALYPASIHFSVQKIEYGTLLTLLGLLLVERTLVLSERPRLAGSLLVGTLAGVGILVNPVILAFCPFGLLWLWTHQNDWRTRLKSAMAIVGCCAAVMAPWLIRNYLVFDQFVFIRSNFTREFVMSSLPDGKERLAAAQVAKNDGETNSFFAKTAWSLVVDKPASFLRGVPRRVRIFWTYLGDSEGKTRLLAGAAYLSVLCLGLAGLWIARSQPRILLPLLFMLSMPIPFYLTWPGRGRFRFPLEPFLILFASYAVVTVASRLPKTRIWARLTAF